MDYSTVANLTPAQKQELMAVVLGRPLGVPQGAQQEQKAKQATKGNPLLGLGAAVAAKKASDMLGGAFSSSLPTTEAENALFNTPGMEASQAAWNTDAGVVTSNPTVTAPSFWSFEGGPFSQNLAGEFSLPSVISGAGALAGAHNLATNWGKNNPVSGAASGAAIGTYFMPGIGTAVGAGLGGLMGMAKAGKHKDQIRRDAVRKRLQEMGFLDDKFNVDLADGTKYDIGRDGSQKLYNIDQSDPNVANAVALINPLGEILTGGDDKLRSDFVGYLGNAATSNAKDPESIKKNILAMYAKNGIGLEQAKGKLQDLLNSKAITDAEKQAYDYGLTTLFGGSPASSGNGGGAKPRRKVRRPIANVPFPDKIPQPPTPAIMPGGPTEAPLPVSVSEFANAYKMAADRLTNNDISNPLSRRL